MLKDLILYTLGINAFIYIASSAVAREWKRIDLKIAALYISTVALMGVFGEVFVGSIYEALFHHHLWDYTAYPIHEGFTSKYAPVLWGSYGFYLYLSHGTLKKYGINRLRHLVLIFGLETVALELIANASYKVLSGQYLFYYQPSDLWHFTSLQAMPFYFVAGYAICKIIRRYEQTIKVSIIMNIYLSFVLVFLTSK